MRSFIIVTMILAFGAYTAAAQDQPVPSGIKMRMATPADQTPKPLEVQEKEDAERQQPNLPPPASSSQHYRGNGKPLTLQPQEVDMVFARLNRMESALDVLIRRGEVADQRDVEVHKQVDGIVVRLDGLEEVQKRTSVIQQKNSAVLVTTVDRTMVMEGKLSSAEIEIQKVNQRSQQIWNQSQQALAQAQATNDAAAPKGFGKLLAIFSPFRHEN